MTDQQHCGVTSAIASSQAPQSIVPDMLRISPSIKLSSGRKESPSLFLCCRSCAQVNLQQSPIKADFAINTLSSPIIYL